MSDQGKIELGVLGKYNVDGDESYGLYIFVCGDYVFIDLKEDDCIEQRKKYAKSLFYNQEKLSNNFIKFIDDNKKFINDRIIYIGLHSKNPDQGEVFLSSGGYIFLKNNEFLAD